MILPDSAILNNLYIPGIAMPDPRFEKSYITCRNKENRVYSDEEVSRLPDCGVSHPHYQEWQVRKASFTKLYSYLEQKKQPLNILEIGCGNGWLCHRLSAISRSRITGVDINFTELQQAARVFNGLHKIKFMFGDIRAGILEDRKYDIILFAASIQYFKSIDEILELSLQHLQPNAEIHITDTRFYSSTEAEAARIRTETYYASLGMPDMSGHYFHHTLRSVFPFNYKVLYDPASFMNRVLHRSLPFHWIRITKD